MNGDPLGPEDEALVREDRRRILVVDDNADLARLTCHLLARLGYEVASAPNGATALEEARSFLPHVILLDIGLPGMDGYELARLLRLVAGMKDALIIAISAYDQQAHHHRLEQAGLDHYLVKPVDFDALLALVHPAPP